MSRQSYFTLYVDAGYLEASMAYRHTNTPLRSSITLDYPALLQALRDEAERHSGLTHLRTYWYDAGANGMPDASHQSIARLPYLKLRLGRLGFEGQQKGVDLRLGLDLATHARRRFADVVYLVSGDDDLSEAVEEAQWHGIQVVALTVPAAADGTNALSSHLGTTVDEIVTLDGDSLDSLAKLKLKTAPIAKIAKSAVPKPPRVAAGSALVYSGQPDGTSFVSPKASKDDQKQFIVDSAERVVAALFSTTSAAQLRVIDQNRPQIPADADRALLTLLSEKLDTYEPIPDPVRHELRLRFWKCFSEKMVAKK